MKKGCAVILLVWAACVAIYARLAYQKIHEVAPAAVIGVLGGTFAGMLIGSVIGLFTGGKDGGAFKRLRRGDPPRGGRLEAASGPIRPLGAPLTAPLTGRPCVMYDYTVKPGDEGAADFAGVAMTPCAIESRRGPARVLGWPVLDEFKSARETAFDRARGEAYLRDTPAEKLGLGKLLSAFSELVADDDGQIRKDFRSEGAEPRLEGKKLEEKIVAPGQVVTLLGIWDEARGGFTPGGRASLNRLFPGPLDTVEKKVVKNPWKQLGVALFFFTALHAILVPMWFLAGRETRASSGSSSSSGSSGAASVWDERDCDRVKELLAKGANPNVKQQGETALMNASRYGNLACVQALLAAGARVDDTNPRGDTALMEAVMAGRDDVVAELKRAGAKDFRVTAELGRRVREGSETFRVVKQYLAAVHAGDFETMARLKPDASRFALESRRADLPLWQSIRPKDPRLVEGFETAMSATITVSGDVGAGSGVVSYDVEKTMDGWQISREWFAEGR